MRKIEPGDITDFLPKTLGDATPGYALAVIDGDEVQTICQGQAVLEHGLPITPETAFRIASVTKHFLALIALIYHDRKVIDIDAPLGRYLSDLSGVQAGITLRQALQNCSGIRDHLELATIAGGNIDQPVSVAQSLEMIARQTHTNFPPGSNFLYSIAGFLLVTLAVEQAVGRSLGELMLEHLFAPNGMDSTSYQPHHTSIIANLATGYLERDGSFEKARFAQELTGEGAIVSTLSDLVRWYRYLRADPDGLVARLSEPTVFSGGTTSHYALGFFNRDFHGTASRGHNGLWPGYRTDLVRFDELDIGMICIANLNTIDPTGITRSLIKVLNEDRLDTDTITPEPSAFAALTSTEAFVNEDTLEFAHFSTEDGKLMIDFGGLAMPVDITAPTQAMFPVPGDYQALDWSNLDDGVVHLTRMNGERLTLTQVTRLPAPQAQTRITGVFACGELSSTLEFVEIDGVQQARLRGGFAHRTDWSVTPLTRDVIVLGDDTGPAA